MTLSELKDEVYTLTGRPDLVGETLSAIKSATLKAHQSDFYSKDLTESGISFTTAAYTQQLSAKELFPRWRKIKYLRKFDSVSNAAGAFFEVILPEEVLDGWGVTRDNVCYEAGVVLNIRSSSEFQYGILGFYQHPDVTEVGYNSWIASDFPYVIIFEAAALVFKAIGLDENASMYRQLVMEQFQLLKTSELALTGY